MKTLVHTLHALAFLTLYALASPATAASCGPIGSADNFRAHHDNYAIWNKMQNNGWAGADESAARVQYSFKYTLLGCAPKAQHKQNGFAPAADTKSSEVSVAYTGQFDFYMGMRPSGPVINRISDPGIHWRRPAKNLIHNLADNTAVVFSLEHRSDGQVFEPTQGTGPEVAQRAYDRRTAEDRALFDTISRGSNYVGLHRHADQTFAGQRVDFSAMLRAYFSQDTAITWGPLRNSGTRIADYDRVWLHAGTLFPEVGYWELAWRVCDNGLKTHSFDLSWQAPEKWGVPLYARLHRGPMNTLSNYTQRQESFGLGLRFTSL